jgi:hypothetical protein
VFKVAVCGVDVLVNGAAAPKTVRDNSGRL